MMTRCDRIFNQSGYFRGKNNIFYYFSCQNDHTSSSLVCLPVQVQYDFYIKRQQVEDSSLPLVPFKDQLLDKGQFLFIDCIYKYKQRMEWKKMMMYIPLWPLYRICWPPVCTLGSRNVTSVLCLQIQMQSYSHISQEFIIFQLEILHY